MKHALLAPVLAVALVSVSGPVPAQTGSQHDQGKVSASKPVKMATGEVRRINKSAKTITIAHGPLEDFNMGPMTMSFPVKDPAQLARVKQGDKVRFALEMAGQDLVITRIEPAR
jgi:Cu/Ag efflux protein CusF